MDEKIGSKIDSASLARMGIRTVLGSVLHNRIVQGVAALLVITSIVGGVFFFWQEARTPIFHDTATLLTIRYPIAVVRAGITDDDKRAKIIFRATESGIEAATPFLITARYEDGLRKISSMLRYDILDILTDNVDKLFPGQYPKFEKIDEKRYSLNGKKAAEIVFSYLSPVGEEVKQRFVIVMRDEDMAMYMTAQAKEKDFESLNKKYFENIISSLRFRLK